MGPVPPLAAAGIRRTEERERADVLATKKSSLQVASSRKTEGGERKCDSEILTGPHVFL